ncbi:hypothetical protein H5410_061464 [Solanum commersonii]|uniref:Uncharacterized protein n=1 Tax=Solanum commersonii TaxID=4109 RepID=A0A9J5W827_SOLCO|nr:hypothetical protein H5410_061464 [Solanum commersonii]
MSLLIIPRQDFSSWEEEDVPRVYEGEKGEGIPEGSEVGVDKDASAGNESTSTSGEVSVGTTLLLSSLSHVNSTSICRISVEKDGVTSISLAGSRGTRARRYNLVIRTCKGRDVCVCLALIAISCETSSPRLIHLLALDRTKASRLLMMLNGPVLGWHDSVANETKPVPRGDVHIPLLNWSSCTQPPRGGGGAMESVGATEGGARFGTDSIIGVVAADVTLISVD